MFRRHNTDRNGNPFSVETKRAVWNKAQIVPGQDYNMIRKDRCGAWITWEMHGNTTANGNGWEVDHIIPVSRGGDDSIGNLQPLQWQNNRRKGDDYPANNYCIVSAS